MKSLLVAVAIGGWLITGCSRSGGIPDSQRLRNAPTEASRTGYLILGGKESDLAELAISNPAVFVRPINKPHGLYEVYGAHLAELRTSVGPDAQIEKNQYRRVIPRNSNHEFSILNLSTKNDFLNNCRNFKADQTSFEIKPQNEIDKFEISHIYMLGETVEIQIKSNQPQNFRWEIDAPYGSAHIDKSGFGQTLEFTPDISGEYILSVIGKDRLQNCRVQKKNIYVTANPALQNKARLSKIKKANFDLEGFWHLEPLKAKEAWAKSTGKNVVIAVVDTGVNYNHESLNENIYTNPYEIPGNNIDDDGNGYIDDSYGYDFSSSDGFPFDDNGHGTHVAGLAAASTFGIAKDAKIMALKTLTGLGTDTGTFTAAIYYAVDQGAHIINASFGWKTDNAIFRKAMEYARDKGVLVVTASGNGNGLGMGIDNDLNPSYPTNYDHPNIVSVAATDEDNELAPYSNFGKQTVDIATFGGASWLKLYSTAYRNVGGRIYIGQSGTSQASPIVAGAAALLLSANPGLTASELRMRLIQSAEKQPLLHGLVLSAGTLNLPRLLSSL